MTKIDGKVCAKCKMKKQAHEYPKNKRLKSGLQSYRKD